jgi:cyclophilin family peptidyl-prolyl cis-trans isomerase
MQMVIFLVVTCLVFDSYNKAVTTTERLDNFKEEESILMMHLQKIEKQSINLHENLSRLNDMSGGIDPSQVRGKQQLKKKTGVDSELIRVQTQQLYQMEEELEHELRALQTKLQAVARGNIIRAYGEGPVQVVFELDIPGEEEHNTISILLWYDTPHAAWAWLQEIQKGIWNGSSFTFGKTGFSVDSVPTEPDRNSKLDFVEKSQKTHEPWTVGLTELEGGGGLRMFINLQDNSGYHKHDVCVGKIIDGFDALQRLVSKTRQLEGSGRSVTIKKATAAHLTRSQSAGLI